MSGECRAVGDLHTLSPFLHPHQLGQNLDGEGFRLESALFSSSPGVGSLGSRVWEALNLNLGKT